MPNFLKNLLNYLKPTPKLNVAYDSGNRKKPTIILLHGIAATSKTWDLLIDKLDTVNNRVIAIDLLGFGGSVKPIDCEYSVDDHIIYLRKTIRKLKVKKPYKIVGHSMGAIIAAHYSNLFPFDIKKQFLLSLPLYSKDDNLHAGFSKTQMELYLNAYKFLADQKQFTILNSQRLRKILKINDGIDVNESNWYSFKMSLNNTVINQDTYNDLKNTYIPTVVIFGVLDEFLVQKSINRLSNHDHIKTISVNFADHTLNDKFAKVVADQISAD